MLNRLKYFVVVAEHLSFSDAARALGMSQPPLSQQIQKLEAELDVQLFVRTNRSVSLTPAGEALLDGARMIMSQMSRTALAARSAAGGETGSLTCGFTDDNTRGLTVDVLTRFHGLYPNVFVSSQVDDSRTLTQLVEQGQLDAAIVSQSAPSQKTPPLRTLKLPSLEFVAIAPSTHRLAGAASINLIELRDDPFIFIPRRQWTGFYAEAGRLFDDAGFTPNIIHETFSTDTIISLVSAGAGVSLATRGIAERFAQTISVLSLKTPATLSRSLVWREDNSSKTLENFRQLLRETIESRRQKEAS